MGDFLTRERFERRLKGRKAAHAFQGRNRAAVAVFVRFDQGAEVLLMRRSINPADPWSGHVSLPGGREEPVDTDLVATATRETGEELGFDLMSHGDFLGPLDAVPAMSRGRFTQTVVHPFVFAQRSAITLQLGTEAAGSFWLPLKAAFRGELDDVYEYRMGNSTMQLPCWRHQGEVVWGLTYQMLRSLQDTVG